MCICAHRHTTTISFASIAPKGPCTHICTLNKVRTNAQKLCGLNRQLRRSARRPRCRTACLPAVNPTHVACWLIHSTFYAVLNLRDFMRKMEGGGGNNCCCRRTISGEWAAARPETQGFANDCTVVPDRACHILGASK